MWAVGTFLIVLSWFSVVSATVGWVGFGVGLAGSVISWGVRPPRVQRQQESPPARPPDIAGLRRQLEKLKIDEETRVRAQLAERGIVGDLKTGEIATMLADAEQLLLKPGFYFDSDTRFNYVRLLRHGEKGSDACFVYRIGQDRFLWYLTFSFRDGD